MGESAIIRDSCCLLFNWFKCLNCYKTFINEYLPHDIATKFILSNENNDITWIMIKQLLTPYVRNIFMAVSREKKYYGKLLLVVDEEKNNKNVWLCKFVKREQDIIHIQLTGEHFHYVRSPYNMNILNIDDNVVFGKD
jgi:hypothetical protein